MIWAAPGKSIQSGAWTALMVRRTRRPWLGSVVLLQIEQPDQPDHRGKPGRIFIAADGMRSVVILRRRIAHIRPPLAHRTGVIR
jgi:hypothetical protein